VFRALTASTCDRPTVAVDPPSLAPALSTLANAYSALEPLRDSSTIRGVIENFRNLPRPTCATSAPLTDKESSDVLDAVAAAKAVLER
jgi:hypothetical protein